MNKKKPSTEFLVILNGLIFYSSGAIHCNIIGILITMPFMTAIYMAFSGIWHKFIINVIEKKNVLKPMVRLAAFILPFLLLLGVSSLDIDLLQSINKQRPATSPSGKHKAIVYTEDGSWILEIDSPGTEHDYKKRTGFVSHLNVYWLWDKNDNFWIYNSDDGSVYFWKFDDSKNSWDSVYWGCNIGKDTNEDLYPPAKLFPDYARKRFPTTRPVDTAKSQISQQKPTLEQ